MELVDHKISIVCPARLLRPLRPATQRRQLCNFFYTLYISRDTSAEGMQEAQCAERTIGRNGPCKPWSRMVARH